MKRRVFCLGAGALSFAALLALATAAFAQTDPLPSWNDGPAKKAIVDFVQSTMTNGNPKFVPSAERIATFDQDGALWVEHPMYSQVIYCGRPPVAAFGNSTGDRQMLEYTAAGDGARLMMLVLHDDATREYAYDPALGMRDTKVGAFTQALYDETKKRGWIVISMKYDWKKIFAFE